MTGHAASPESTDRMARFRAEVDRLVDHSSRPDRDRTLARAGAVAMGAGIVVAIIAYAMSHGTTNPLTQRDALVVGLVGVCVTVAGGALYLRHGLAHFLRLWLARLIVENAASRRAEPDEPSSGGPT